MNTILLFVTCLYYFEDQPNKKGDVDANILPPTFSVKSGFYDSDFDLELNSESGTRIYYTTDNTIPTEKSTLYNGSIKISDASLNDNIASAERNISSVDNTYIPDYKVDKCNVIKAISIDEFGNTSSVSTAVYFVGFDKKKGYDGISIMSLSLEPDDLFGYVQGIYTIGRTYRKSSDEVTSVANYTQRGIDWERLATLSYFNCDRNYL